MMKMMMKTAMCNLEILEKSVGLTTCKTICRSRIPWKIRGITSITPTKSKFLTPRRSLDLQEIGRRVRCTSSSRACP